MLKTLTSLSVLALVALTAPAIAQQSGDNTTQTTEGQPQTADSQLDLGQPVEGNPRLGERYSKEKIGDWDLACIKTEGDQDPCSLLQILTDENNNPMAEFSLFRIKGQGPAIAGATVIVPLETLLPAQLTMSVDGAPGKRYNYSFCNPYGCVAQVGLTQADIDAFKQGNAAILSLVPAPAPDQLVTLKLSLKGFTAGFDKVDVVNDK